MKNKFLSATALFILLSAATVKAQGGFNILIKSGPQDATKLVDAYGLPFFKGLGMGMNSGWTNTAKTNGLLHFDLRITGTAVFVPDADKTFDVTKIGLSNNIRPDNAANVIAPTFSGNTKIDGPLMNIYDDNGNKVSSFTLPKGQLSSVVPAPQLQLTVGLIQNTDVTVRAIPKVKISDKIGSASMLGFGIKHDIIQDFAGAGHPIPFDLAFAFSYNRLNYSKSLNVQPEDGAEPANAQQSTDFSNQSIEGHMNSFLFEAIVSKQILFFTPYIAAGYNTAKTDVSFVGNYPITSNEVPVINQKFYNTYKDPVKINERNVNAISAEIGFQLKLPIFRFYASYGILDSYRMVNAGIGFGI
ncbi:DUF6588 family protein [Mucilaginibacter agri]|uniref:Outer membrane protein beta-barrel domain-containing protein n=1 Tax=Mucilaginibacter agri TaxID=2695265 RepID=A0A965ZD67_9SPHI|nr:DUF6588 family protein [Mucilaginibacter agri]NCD68540.1 hypothetical protein [Mucilaginibacter agri]